MAPAKGGQLATAAAGNVQKWTADEKKIIQSQFFPEGTSTEEMKYCMSVAEGLGLNPILKQIWFVPRRSQLPSGQWREKVEPMAGRDSFLTLGHRSGQFAGIKSWVEIKEGPSLVNGEWEMKKDLYGIAEVLRKDTPEIFRVEVKYAEYVQTKKDGTPTKFWSGKPETMIKKVAESQALRKAFNIAGLYDESEIETSLKDVNVKVTDTETPKMIAERERSAFERIKGELIDCDTVEALSDVMKAASEDKEEVGYLWAQLDQEYMLCLEDMQKPANEPAPHDATTGVIKDEKKDMNSPVEGDENFGQD